MNTKPEATWTFTDKGSDLRLVVPVDGKISALAVVRERRTEVMHTLMTTSLWEIDSDYTPKSKEITTSIGQLGCLDKIELSLQETMGKDGLATSDIEFIEDLEIAMDANDPYDSVEEQSWRLLDGEATAADQRSVLIGMKHMFNSEMSNRL